MDCRSIIDTDVLSDKDIADILELSVVLKAAAEEGAVPPLLSDMILAIMFDSPSTRSRLSFDAAMSSLGGSSVYLPIDALHMGSGMETVRDTAHVVSTMVDAVALRSTCQWVVDEFSREASVPVLSAMGADGLHPAQALADLLTLWEHLPDDKSLADVTVVLLGDTTDEGETKDCVFASLYRLLPRLGVDMIACSPEGFGPSDKFVRLINEGAQKKGGSLRVIEDPREAVCEADFVYAGAWVYYEDGHTREAAEKIFSPKYQLNDRLLEEAPSTCKVMHYMPGNRGLEIADSVWDSDRSLLLEEAANRLAVARGMLAWSLAPHRRMSSDKRRHMYRERVFSILDC